MRIVDSAEVEWQSGLFFVNWTPANLATPAGIALGTATVTVLVDGVEVAAGEVEILDVAPGIFFFGQRVAAAFALTVAADGTRTQTNVFAADFTPQPIDLGPDGTQVFLLMFGTGIRDATTITAAVNGISVPVLGFLAQPQIQGLDQVNIGPLPRGLIGSGVVEIVFTVDGVQSNPVQAQIQ